MRITKGSLVTIEYYKKWGTVDDYWLAIERDNDSWRVTHILTGHTRIVRKRWLRLIEEK